MYCGPYALALCYQHFGDPKDSFQISREVKLTRSGVECQDLVKHALLRGYAVTRYHPKKSKAAQERAVRMRELGGIMHLDVSFTQSFLRTLIQKGPMVVNISAREYIKQIGRTKKERRIRSPAYHYLFVHHRNEDGYYESDDAYTTESSIQIPEDMMCRMLHAHHDGGNILVVRKKENCRQRQF